MPNYLFHASADDFKKIPGSPIAYWVSDKVREIFETSPSMGEVSYSSNGVQTGDNSLFVRLWYEVSLNKKGIKWFPYNKGGEFRKWYGNNYYFVDWEDEGYRAPLKTS